LSSALLVAVLIALIGGSNLLGTFLGLSLFMVLWSCSIVRVWRPLVILGAVILGVILMIAPIVNSANFVSTIRDSYPRMISEMPWWGYVIIAGGALGGASGSIALGWQILSDGWRVTTMSDEQQRLMIGSNRRFTQTLAMMFGIHPICKFLPRIIRRLVSRGLFLLSGIAAGFAVLLVVIIFLKLGSLIGPVIPCLFSSRTSQYSGCSAAIGMPQGFIGFIGAAVAIVALLRYSARRYARVSVEDLASVDARPPILFLRSFQEDQVELARPRRGVVRAAVAVGEPSPTLDHSLLEEATPFGPVVAIGVPGSPAPFGIARTYANDKEWQNVVAGFAENAKAIVIVVDDTRGVDWELRHIERAGHSSKALYLLPPRLASSADSARIIYRDVFRSGSTISKTEPSPIESLSGPCVGWYRISPGKVALLTCRRPSQASYVCALRLFARDVILSQ
jgi:hypothetical protein